MYFRFLFVELVDRLERRRSTIYYRRIDVARATMQTNRGLTSETQRLDAIHSASVAHINTFTWLYTRPRPRT